jgi:hypothetical protein
MIAQHSCGTHRHGWPHRTQGLPPGSMSSSPIVLSLWYAPFIPSSFSLLSTSPLDSSFFRNDRVTQQHPKNQSINTSRPMNASTYAKTHSGVCMHPGCRTTWYRTAPFMEDDGEKIATCRYFARSVLTIWLTSFRR